MTTSHKNELLYDVFMSYSSKDREAVQLLYDWLVALNMHPWMDVHEARPGRPWQDALQEGISGSGAVAVFVGPSGLGPWEVPEMNAALREQVDRGCPVIPVILPGCDKEPQLPLFLRGNTWVDFRDGLENQDARGRLYWGITGSKLQPQSTPLDSLGHLHSSGEQPGLIFVTNDLFGCSARVYQTAVAPAATNLKMSVFSLNDVKVAAPSSVASAIEESVARASIVICMLNSDHPYIPLPLQTQLSPEKKLIMIVERGISLPELLSYAETIGYRDSDSGMKRLQEDLSAVLRTCVEFDRLAEAKQLVQLGFYESSIVAASNYLHDFLRNHAVEKLGYKYFKEKPIRYYSLSELFKLLTSKRKLRTRLGVKIVNWKELVQVRNSAAHGATDIDCDTAQWYVDEVTALLSNNSD